MKKVSGMGRGAYASSKKTSNGPGARSGGSKAKGTSGEGRPGRVTTGQSTLGVKGGGFNRMRKGK